MRGLNKFGIAFAGLHAAVVAYLLYLILFANEGDWPMYWLVLYIPDIPILLVEFALSWIPFPSRIEWLPISSPMSSIWNFWEPLLALGGGGTLWWYWIGTVFDRLVQKIMRSKKYVKT